jgi:DNA invertase Pin-like site-specific DNA recombinase
MAASDAGLNAPDIDRPAAQYVRMSTDHQRYSTANQSAVLQVYAETHSFTIVRTYSDEGKSGLRLAGRAGLTQLIADVQSGDADFEALLVYDVSRWGRFQDADESAHYEFLLRRAGVEVIYCAEPFQNDGTPIAAIFKSVKRAMAAEFSRELSIKVFAGHCRLAQLGYKQGGVPGYGYRRQLVDSTGQPKGLLQRGERKSLHADRVVLVPGPPDEIATVRAIFEAFVHGKMDCQAIASSLNTHGVAYTAGRAWSRCAVQLILKNEKYVGTYVFGRMAFRLKQRRVPRPEQDWVRRENSHPALVSQELFDRAQQRFAAQVRARSDEDLLPPLRALFDEHGRLTGQLINRRPGLARAETYARRFGSLNAAFARVGFQRQPGSQVRPRYTMQRSRRTPIVVRTLSLLKSRGAQVEDRREGVFAVNGEFTFTISQVRPAQLTPGHVRWLSRFRRNRPVDFRIVARLMSLGEQVLDYFIFPSDELDQARFSLPEDPPAPYAFYRFNDLEPLLRMAERVGREEMR